jgi:DsbE subfamily thiol:disulfide oxidoreductase
MSANRLMHFLPVAIFLLLVAALAWRLELIGQGKAPNVVPSVMVGRPVPVFSLPPLQKGKPNLTSTDLKGKVTLVSMFASWCEQCMIEHPLLDEVKKAGIALVGIDYKDRVESARTWLAKLGNPYDAIGVDADGRAAIDFGVYGVPESYLIDKQGIIRFKQTGPLKPDILQNTILPLAKELSQ